MPCPSETLVFSPLFDLGKVQDSTLFTTTLCTDPDHNNYRFALFAWVSAGLPVEMK